MRRRKEQAAVVAAPTRTFYDVGLNGTVDEFRQANKGAFDYRYSSGQHHGTQSQRDLQRGAIQAFLEGRPENLQTVFANLSEFKIGVEAKFSTETVDRKKILFDLTEGSDRPAAIIALALAQICEPEKKQEVLDEVLCDAVHCNPYPGEEAFVSALLKAGANANAEFMGSPGKILAMAITYAHPPRVVKMLYDGGASFDDALFRMRTKPFWDDKREMCIEKLKAYRQEITGEAATVEVRPEILLEMRQMIADFTEAAKDKKPAAQPAAARAKKTAAPTA